jgi:hypothetical protein
MKNNPINGWSEWSKYVLKELERLNTCYEKLDSHLDKIATDIATLKVKASIWGAIGGIVPVAIILAWMLLKK